jgi:crotonobetainyl-CoA:carnitine CoA-transferase CaiB-like acyl-CoA transferase
MYPCKPHGPNDWCFVHLHAESDDEWRRLAAAIGRNELAEDIRFSTLESRLAHIDAVDDVIAAWTSSRTAGEVMEGLDRAGIGAGAVLSTEDLVKDSYLLERGAFATVQDADGKDKVIPGWPVQMSESRVRVRSASPPGDDTEEILRELLGYETDRVEQLRSAEID